MRTWWVVLAALAATGCIDDFPAAPGFDAAGRADGGVDARPADAADPDARPADRGVGPDGARPDATRPDEGPLPTDAGPTDGSLDATTEDAAVPDAAILRDGCAPSPEICNGIDDDCNGRVDDLPVLESPCQVVGVDCVGVLRCDTERQAVICEPRPDADEVCNGADDDCDGRTDEGDPGGGGACMLGVGICAADGTLHCEGGRLACDAVPGAPAPETCNGLDDDCNGTTDDAPGIGAPCAVGVGACSRQGENICRMGSATPVCSASAGQPAAEVCNGLDDDCDGTVDDVPGVGEACTVGLGRCQEVGVNTCLDGELRCNARPGVPMAELCDAADNDCDGSTDEAGTCAGYVTAACRAWLGWAGNGLGAQRPAPTWGGCPASLIDGEGDEHCAASRDGGASGASRWTTRPRSRTRTWG
ncbi:MAG: MopE-related protein [bacterium]